jgi:hypothetical protein
LLNAGQANWRTLPDNGKAATRTGKREYQGFYMKEQVWRIHKTNVNQMNPKIKP